MPDTVSVTASQSWLPYFAIVAALLAPTIATIVGVWLANRNAERARVAAEHVEQTLSNSTSRIDKKLDSIHQLTNSRLAAALAKIDALERRLFVATGEIPSGEASHPLPPPTVDYPEDDP